MRYSLIIFFLLIFSLNLYSAEPDTLCATDNSELETVGTLLNTTYTLKVLLVQFTDIQHDPDYTSSDWNNLFFSQWSYVTPNMSSPDGESVYGSMRDYFSLMSDGEFELAGSIINPDNNGDGKPDWITLSNSKNYYHSNSNYTFRTHAKNAAIAAGLDVSTNSTTKLCILYAGHMYRLRGGLCSDSRGLGVSALCSLTASL